MVTFRIITMELFHIIDNMIKSQPKRFENLQEYRYVFEAPRNAVKMDLNSFSQKFLYPIGHSVVKRGKVFKDEDFEFGSPYPPPPSFTSFEDLCIESYNGIFGRLAGNTNITTASVEYRFDFVVRKNGIKVITFWIGRNTEKEYESIDIRDSSTSLKRLVKAFRYDEVGSLNDGSPQLITQFIDLKQAAELIEDGKAIYVDFFEK